MFEDLVGSPTNSTDTFAFWREKFIWDRHYFALQIVKIILMNTLETGSGKEIPVFRLNWKEFQPLSFLFRDYRELTISSFGILIAFLG